jgi:hypothetical protein
MIIKSSGALGFEHYGTLAANAQIGVVKPNYAVAGNRASKLNCDRAYASKADFENGNS